MVHSTKHYVQKSLATITAGAVDATVIAAAVPVADKNLVSEVEEGSSVKAVYMEYWMRSGSTTGSSGQWILYKKNADTTFASGVDMAALGDWDNKKNILATGMGLFNDQDADAIAIMRGWYKIPKSKQRFGLGDVLALSIFVPTVDAHICGFSTFKEYT